MVDEGKIQHPRDSSKRKGSRHWDLEETKKLFNKLGGDNIQERTNSSTSFLSIIF